jgi:hypothetical protein
MSNQSDTHNADGTPLTPRQRLARGFTWEGKGTSAEAKQESPQKPVAAKPEETEADLTPRQRLREGFTFQGQ